MTRNVSTPYRVDITSTKTLRLAVLEHRGDALSLQASIDAFVAWRKAHNLSPQVAATFNIPQVEHNRTHPDNYWFDLGVEVEGEVSPNAMGLIGKIIPGGRCAVLRLIGSDQNLGNSIRYLYARWLAQQGEQASDVPLYLQRVAFAPFVPEDEAITDIYLPLK